MSERNTPHNFERNGKPLSSPIRFNLDSIAPTPSPTPNFDEEILIRMPQ
jgi:hypothetical protein